MNINEQANFIWSIADLLRGDFKQSEYGKVILPFTVLRRFDCVLAPSKAKILEANKTLTVSNKRPIFKRMTGHDYYNVSQFDFEKLMDDSNAIEANLRDYINGFSEDVREIMDNFEIFGVIDRLSRANLLYRNPDIIPERLSYNVHFKKASASYTELFAQMESSGTISTRGLKPDAIHYGELIFDVNSAYFHNHGGYEFAKQFYAEAYQAAVKIVGGEQYILSAVMHADEINRAMSEALGQDVYHYHLHVVYVPVVGKQILWSKRCKDKALVGTVKETIMQVSRSKKWLSQPALDEAGNPVLQKNGKPVLKKSYSILQDDFYQHMRAAGYTDVERGERGSTEEHLTVTQFKVAQEQQRLEDVTAQIAQKEQTLDSAQAAVEKKQKELQFLQKQTKEQRTAALTVQEIRSMGKKTITGNITLTPSECSTLKDYAVNGILAKAENSRLEAKLQSAQKSAAVWKQRYESLKEQARPYLEAVKLAPEKVRAFLNAILTQTRETKQHDQSVRRKSQDMEL